jgi:hypothetical protein
MSYVSSRQRRINKQVRDSIVRRLIDWVGQILFATVIGVFFSFIVINWLSGCGERFPTSNGGYVQGECIYPSQIWNDYRATQSAGEE